MEGLLHIPRALWVSWHWHEGVETPEKEGARCVQEEGAMADPGETATCHRQSCRAMLTNSAAVIGNICGHRAIHLGRNPSVNLPQGT